MEIGSVNSGSSSQQVSQSNAQQEVRQQDQQQRQAEIETAPAATENNPQPDSRVGPVINTQV